MINKILAQIRIKIEDIIRRFGIEETDVLFETPKDKEHGDFSTNIAMRLARPLRKNPNLIANDIVGQLDLEELHLEKVVVLNGFINFYIKREYLANIVFEILRLKEDFGQLNIGEGQNVNIEFVSANPTGYLHIGHGRGAAYGDSLTRIMRKAGYQVTTEHYVNDAGNQINNLILSIYERYRELFGLPFQLGDDSYHGPEIIEIAKKIRDLKDDYYLHHPFEEDFQVSVWNFDCGLKKDLTASELNLIFGLVKNLFMIMVRFKDLGFLKTTISPMKKKELLG